MTNYVYIATSLDGFIATPDGGLDWLNDIPNPDQSDYGFADFMAGIDAIAMGRKTFEIVSGFDSWAYDKPVFVLSRSLKSLPASAQQRNVELIQGEPQAVVQQLHQRSFQNLYIDGGQTIRNFLDCNLIDDLIITRIPILLGDGIPLFIRLKESQSFNHLKTEIYNETLVKSHYKRKLGKAR